jgi:arylsulfatase A-like enzyme
MPSRSLGGADERLWYVKAIMVMFDSLNRRFLSPYGCDWVRTPNFARLAERTVTFDSSFVGSMPCMPARRELHTGRYNFLHRSWGPLEPFDDSMPEILKRRGIYTHLASDHYHYWEDGGCTYHSRYSTWEISRGQEGDPWIPDITPDIPAPDPDINPRADMKRGAWYRQDRVNRKHMRDERDQPQPKTFAMAERFLRTNHAADDWFLHVETFDPHEPYFSPKRFHDLYEKLASDGIDFDWPGYDYVKEPPEIVEHLRLVSAALHTMCDEYLGRILDLMDEYGLWKDTMLIVNTDHGFMLGEHDMWAKCWQPFYNEIAHTPLFIWDPRSQKKGERRASLVQTIDLPATVLEYFGVDLPADMQGVPLRDTVASDAPVREAGLYGIHGGHVNCTDGRYVYMRAPAGKENRPLYNYTLMPTHMRGMFGVDELKTTELANPFAFTKGLRTMRIASGGPDAHSFGTMLFDLEADPGQDTPLRDAAVEDRMLGHLKRLMRENDAPPEQYERLGID